MRHVTPLVVELQPEFSAEEADYAHEIYRVLARRTGTAVRTARDVNRFWLAKAMRYIADDPGSFLRRLAVKVYLVFHGSLQHDQMSSLLDHRRLAASSLPSFSFAVLSALAFAGVAVSLRDWRRLLVCYAIFASQTARLLLMYVSERQRMGSSLAAAQAKQEQPAAARGRGQRSRPQRRSAMRKPAAIAVALLLAGQPLLAA